MTWQKQKTAKEGEMICFNEHYGISNTKTNIEHQQSYFYLVEY